MAALDEAGFGVSRYHVENGFRDRLALALEEAEMILLKTFSEQVKTSAIACINLSSCLNAVGFSRRSISRPRSPNLHRSFRTRSPL